MSFLQIPKPVARTVQLNGREWKLSLYEEYLPHWDETAIAELEKYLPKRSAGDFRVQVTIKGVPFLAGVLAKEREIVIGSPRLHWELFLLKGDVPLDYAAPHNQGERPLKEHVEKISSIDLKNSPTLIEQITDRYGLPDFLQDAELQGLCEKSRALEGRLTEEIQRYRPTLFEKLSDLFLKWTSHYPLFRIHLLKFIAMLPCLDHDRYGKEVKRVYLETLRRILADAKKSPLPWFLKTLFRLEYFFSKFNPAFFLARSIRIGVRRMARRFIAGESIEKAAQVFKSLRKTGRDITLDQLGELVVSEKEADRYCEEVLKLVHGLVLHIRKGEKNSAGIERAHISLKVSALTSDFKPQAPEYTYERVAPRLKKILVEAGRRQVFVNIDAEHYASRDLVFEIYKRVLLETSELKNYQATGIVVQAYLRDACKHFEEILALAKERQLLMPVRLVKGAYWDQETIEADAAGFNAPQFLNKEETDIHFRQLTIKILEAAPHLQLCLASHNLADHCFAETIRSEKFLHAPVIEHQCLHMTYEALSKGMANLSWAVRNYVPIGSLLVGMAYLVRRILENSSQVGILVQMREEGEKGPVEFPHAIHLQKRKAGQIVRDKSIADLSPEFFNTIPLRFHVPEEKEALDRTFEHFTEKELGKEYLKNEYAGILHPVKSPSDPNLLVGKITYASLEDAKTAIAKAHHAYNRGKWAKALSLERASCLLKAAQLMLLKRSELTSLIVHEGGKNFFEAINDVNEAIDFLNFYAREECRLAEENPGFVSRGVFGVISPWNFPLAIPAGMASGALVAGNTVLLKPAEHTPLITQKLAEILHTAGVPKDVFIHLPGKGSEVGKLLVEHPVVAGIVFTGSKQVGLWIAHTAGKRIVHNELFGYEVPVKVITEMGGKNAILVTANAELDETVAGILYSAFGNAGQKCSAASRVLIDNRIKNRLIERLAQGCNDLRVGPAQNHASTVNPLVAPKEKERLEKEAASAGKETHLFGGKIHVDRSKEKLPGCCMGPVLLELPASRALAKESFAQKELFGPILHCIGYSDLEEAIKLFNSTEYGLTGGIFSQSQDDVDSLSRRLQAGNIYVNRTITGARVSIEPFGGFKMSGTGPKAGGPFYLEAFHHALAPQVESVEAKNGLKEKFAAAWECFTQKYHWNRKIPGQLSFNDLNLVKKRGLYIQTKGGPSVETACYLSAAKTVGADVRKISIDHQEKIQKMIAANDLDFLIVEGGKSEVKEILDLVYNGHTIEKQLCTVLSKLDAPDVNDPERYLESFVHIRSFAVNVMRHGAPLELVT